MTPRARRRELRRALRAQKRALRARLAQARAARDPGGARRRWTRRGLWAALLVLLLLRQCACDPPPPAAPEAPAPRAARDAGIRPPPPPPPVPRIEKRRRPRYINPDPREKTWLDALRLAVASRSLRLARCFEGVEAPGAVKWTAVIDPTTGEVSDQRFSSVASRVSLDDTQRRCLEAALSQPPYALPSASAGTAPGRVSLVLEF